MEALTDVEQERQMMLDNFEQSDEQEDSCSFLIEPPIKINHRMFNRFVYQCFYTFDENATSTPFYVSMNQSCDPIYLFIDDMADKEISTELKFSREALEDVNTPVALSVGWDVSLQFMDDGQPMDGLPKFKKGFDSEIYLSAIAWSLFHQFYSRWFNEYKPSNPDLGKIQLTYSFKVKAEYQSKEGIVSIENGNEVEFELKNLKESMLWADKNPKSWTLEERSNCWIAFKFVFLMKVQKMLQIVVDGFDVEEYEGRYITIRGNSFFVDEKKIEEAKERAQSNYHHFYDTNFMNLSVTMNKLIK
jgi:hypothetical protein